MGGHALERGTGLSNALPMIPGCAHQKGSAIIHSVPLTAFKMQAAIWAVRSPPDDLFNP